MSRREVEQVNRSDGEACPPTGTSGQPVASDLPPVPGPNATHEDWRVWGERITKAAEAAGYNLGPVE